MEMHATVQQINGISFIGKADSNHWIVMDGPPEFGGTEAGCRPMELFLIGLAGCSGSDIASILAKKRVKVDKFIMNLSAERRDEHPRIFTKIHIEYLFYGENIPAKDVERAISLSQEKYCSAFATLQHTAAITHTYKILENSEETTPQS